jgi:hypothetical protein
MVRIAMNAMDHVAAHLPEADEADLHAASFSGPPESRKLPRRVAPRAVTP